jgi:hypothetical protein
MKTIVFSREEAMKTLFAAASAIAMLAATPAFAAEQEIKLNANVAAACGAGDHKSGAAADPSYDQAPVTVTLADSKGQFAGQTFTNRGFGNLWCNGPATVTMTVSPMTTKVGVADTSSFVNSFDVQVVTDAGVYFGKGEGWTITTKGSAVVESNTTTGAFETGLRRYGGVNSLTVLADASNRRAVAGAYQGYVRFTATAN